MNGDQRLDEQELIEISVKAGFKQGFKAGYTTGYEKGKSSQKSVLDKISAEIDHLQPKTFPFINHIDAYVKEDDVRKIINKYRAESEGS